MSLSKNWTRSWVLAAALASPLAAAQTTPLDDVDHVASQLANRWGFPDRIEGLWNVRVYLMPCGVPQPAAPSFLAMAMFGRGGTFHDENNANPVAPLPPTTLRSEAFGQWEHVAGRTYRFAFQFYNFDLAGTFTGSTIVRHTVQLAPDANSYTSAGTPEFFTATGEPFVPPGPALCSTSTATRFK